MTSPSDVRRDLLDLHRTVLDAVRREHERARGRLAATEFLAALIDEPQFAWLRPLTTLVTRLDGMRDEDGESKDLRRRLHALIALDTAASRFQQGYAEVLHGNPDVLVAHVKAMRALKAQMESS